MIRKAVRQGSDWGGVILVMETACPTFFLTKLNLKYFRFYYKIWDQYAHVLFS